VPPGDDHDRQDALDDALMGALAGPGVARERALRELVRRHAAPLARALRTLVRDPALVDDLVQETFVRVYEARERWRPGEVGLGAWLYRVARNQALDHLRKTARRATGPIEGSDVAEDPGPGPERAVSLRQTADEVRRAVDALPPQDREVLLLRFDEDRSYEEIAALTGTSAAAVKQRVFRARARVRALLEEGGEA
jgi:RNA polymerase sigma-70 factor (ECF subfamily)